MPINNTICVTYYVRILIYITSGSYFMTLPHRIFKINEKFLQSKIAKKLFT